MIHYDVSDGVCLLRLDSPPLNTISRAALDELQQGICRANADAAVSGIVIAGDSQQFSAGADISLFEQVSNEEGAADVSRVFQEAFGQVEESGKPVVAALAGKVLGGAVELAAACHYRVCTDRTQFNMPEVNLGISPGAGATQRLPRLVGVPLALQMILNGTTINAQQALEAGLVDAVCPADELLDAARKLLSDNSQLRPTGTRTDKIQDQAVNEAALAEAEKGLVRVRPEIIAPRRIIDVVRTGLADSFEAGLLAERVAAGECMFSQAARNKIYLFFATRRAGKIPDQAEIGAKPVSRAAVVGMGSMGSGIAQALLTAGVPVVVYDETPDVPSKALAKIRKSLEKRVSAGKLAPEKLESIIAAASVAGGWQDVAGADFVIEAVFEDTEIKQQVLRELEAVCPAETILSTNTSTISLDVLASVLRHPERFVGTHFFNPAHRMPLVEIICHEGTSDAVVATALRLVRDLKKTPVPVKNREGFLVNRLFLPYVKEAFFLWEEGAEPEAIDRAMVEFGMPMGPLTLIDMAGVDVLVWTDRVMTPAFPHHGAVSDVAEWLVERGQYGQKTSAGVYSYQPGDYTPHRSAVSEELVDRVRREKGITPRVIDGGEITERLSLRMVVEAFAALQEEIARQESDLDVATVLGIGFPDFRGGVIKYARDRGLSGVLQAAEDLAGRYGERFAPCELLRNLAKKGAG